MSFIDKILDNIAPYDCLKCGEEGELLCSRCLYSLPRLPKRCYSCHQSSPGYLTCHKCLRTSGLHGVYVATVYAGASKDLLWRLKSSGSKTAADIMAYRMAALIDGANYDFIVPVPTSAGRVRERGYDQAALLARKLSKYSRIPALSCLRRLSNAHQVGANREKRRSQLQGAFSVINPGIVRNMRIVLVDDVVTTGSTLEAAASALHEAGASQVEAVVFAQPLTNKIAR